MTLRLANADQESGPIPVTRRKLQALQRHCEASARVRRSDTITEADVDRARQVFVSSLTKRGVDPESGEYDADAIGADGASQRSRIKEIRRIVDEVSDEWEDGAPSAR